MSSQGIYDVVARFSSNSGHFDRPADMDLLVTRMPRSADAHLIPTITTLDTAADDLLSGKRFCNVSSTNMTLHRSHVRRSDTSAQSYEAEVALTGSAGQRASDIVSARQRASQPKPPTTRKDEDVTPMSLRTVSKTRTKRKRPARSQRPQRPKVPFHKYIIILSLTDGM